MKKILFDCLIVLLLECFHLSPCHAQQPEPDTVWMEGRVTEAATGLPQPNCEVQLLQEGESKAVAFCDEEGYFSIGWMPTGLYTLSVFHDGKSLYYSEFQLTQSAMVNIALLPDTVALHALRPTEVTASRHQLGSRLITSTHDLRLWDLNGGSGRNGNAAIATPFEPHPLYGDKHKCSQYVNKQMCRVYTTGSLYDFPTPPIWILCNEPWNPTPTKKEEKKEGGSQESTAQEAKESK